MSTYTKSAADYFTALGIGWTWSGLCLWLDENANKYAGELLTLGCKWSEKRQAWYLRCGDVA